MAVSSQEKQVVLGGAGGATTMKLQADEEGWPLVRFEPKDPALSLVGDFLRSDVDIVLPSCDLLIESIQSVLAQEKTHWRWNGNSFIVEVENPVSRFINKYGHLSNGDRSAVVPTHRLLEIIRAWREFVLELPRQRELQDI
jgi:hypothetical protein